MSFPQADIDNEEAKLICVECFTPVQSIFKVYQDGFKDIIQCVNRFSYTRSRFCNTCFTKVRSGKAGYCLNRT